MSNSNTNKQLLFSIIGIAILIIAVMGVTFAFFSYTKTGNKNTVQAGNIEFSSVEGDAINLSNAFPISSEQAATDTTNAKTLQITVTGNTSYSGGIEYLVTATDVNMSTTTSKTVPLTIEVSVEGNNSKTLGTSNDSYYISRGGNTSMYKVEYDGELNEDDHILVGYIAPDTAKTGVDGIINIKAYLNDANILITDTPDAVDTTGKTVISTTEWNSLTGNNALSFKVKVEAREGTWVENPNKLYKKIRSSLTNDNSITDEDNVTYISGCSDEATTDATCTDANKINFNFVWYSGKLWRVISIDNDGGIKLVTENPITNILWGIDNTTYNDSWIYQWLNEDFADTLVNKNMVIDTTKKWNVESTTTKPTTAPTVTGDVGLLNAYEYVESYNMAGNNTNKGYLNINQYWWLITPDNSYIYMVFNDYGGLGKYTANGNVMSVRPSIHIKSNITVVGGNGTRNNPYRIGEDISAPITNANINTRVSGEYVTFKNELYRIVDVDTINNTTKIVKADYLSVESSISQKSLASTAYFGKTGNTESNDYWDYYLNNIWLTSSDLNLLEMGTYYLGSYNYGDNYKKTICDTTNNNEDYHLTTKVCDKLTDSGDGTKVYSGYAGLLRVGEMFSSQLKTDQGLEMWLITPSSSSNVRYVSTSGVSYTSASNTSYVVRPSVNLKSNVIITSGEGTENSPFQIALDT